MTTDGTRRDRIAQQRRPYVPGWRKREWRDALNEQQVNRCAWCDGPMGDDMTLDHIVPWSRGGADELANLQLMHLACNQEKADD